MVGKKRLNQCAGTGKANHAYLYIYLEQEKSALCFWDVIFSPLIKVSLAVLQSIKSEEKILTFSHI